LYTILNNDQLSKLQKRGFEIFAQGGSRRLPLSLEFEVPSGIKYTQIEQSISIGAFSYIVSGFMCGVNIGRYCSFGENVQIGRQNHPKTWLSTSPFTYMNNINIMSLPEDLKKHCSCKPMVFSEPPTKLNITNIENDIWIGHGAIINAGVKISSGAIIASGSVVTKDVNPYAIVGGNPAKLIRFRFEDHIVEKLIESAWWDYSPDIISRISVNNIEEALEQLTDIRKNEQPFISMRYKLSDLNEVN
jgi:acetyltransferase-like isoleucine patch superfamily enzyme